MNQPRCETEHVNEAIAVPGPADAVWSALTREAAVRPWWGMLDQDLDAVGRQAMLRTGSGSFYQLWVEEAQPPTFLRLASSYLGVSAPTWTQFEIIPAVPGASDLTVRVREHLVDPEPASLYLLAQLWRYRLRRLQATLTGTPVPRESDVLVCSSPLPSVHWRPLHRHNLTTWLPVSADQLPPRWFYAIDEFGARPFPIVSWRMLYDERLLLQIRVGPRAVTRAEVSVGTVPQSAELTLQVRHGGWTRVSRDAQDRFVLRSRFLATWREALHRATAEPS